MPSPLRPPQWVSPPAYIEYQLASVIMERVLAPLRMKILKRLEDLMLANQPSNWFLVFLTCFALLHSYELIFRLEISYAKKRKLSVGYLPAFYCYSQCRLRLTILQVRYSDMNRIRSYQIGSKTILAHFHDACKGNVPLCPDFDWDSTVHRRMAELTAARVEFMRGLIDLARSTG